MLGVFGKFALAGAAGGTGITGNVYAASSAGAEVRRAATRARNHPHKMLSTRISPPNIRIFGEMHQSLDKIGATFSILENEFQWFLSVEIEKNV